MNVLHSIHLNGHASVWAKDAGGKYSLIWAISICEAQRICFLAILVINMGMALHSNLILSIFF